MAIPSKFGDYYKSQLPTINFLGTTSTSSSKTNWGQLASGIAGYGLGIFAEVMAAKNASGAGNAKKVEGDSTTKEQSAASTPEGQLALAKGQKEALESQIKSYSDTMADLAPKIDEAKIQQKEANVNAMKEKLFGDKAKDKELVQQIQNCNARIDTATANLNGAKANVASLSAEISALTTEKGNIDALAEEEGPDQASAKTRSAELQVQIDAKNIQIDQEKKKAEDAQEQLDLAENEQTKLKSEQEQKYTQIQLDLETYNKESAEVQELRSTLQTNKTNYDTAANQKAKLEADLAKLESEIKSFENKLLAEKGEKIKQTNDLGDKYTEADANDGNWWKRNMPSWLGGASKEDKEAMKKAHEAKDDAVDAMKALGGSKSDLKEMQKENVAELVDNFLSGKQTIDGIEDDIADAIRTGGTAAAENVYNQELENLATEKAEAFISKQVKNKTYDSKSQTKAIYNDDKYKKQIIEMYKSNLEITDEQIKAKLNLS